jgi:AraC-like DNA-binding protein
MAVRYAEWKPARALDGVVAALWHVRGDDAGMPPSSVLPDANVELIVNRGTVSLAGPAFTGVQPARGVVGLLSKALSLAYDGPIDTFGIRFHPAAGASFFGRTGRTLLDQILPLAAVSPSLDRALAAALRKGTDLASSAWRATVTELLLAEKVRSLPRDVAISKVVERLIASSEERTVEELAEEVGLSTRQLQRRFLAAVGVAPKRFLRLTRFAKVWQVATMRPEASWASLAAEYGYADQAHLVREFRAFGTKPPTRTFDDSWYASTGFTRETGPARGVRFVQEPSGGGELEARSSKPTRTRTP